MDNKDMTTKINELLQKGKYSEISALLSNSPQYFTKNDASFLEKDYHKKSRKEKIASWVGDIHQQMRWIGEEGKDEMSLFSKKEYEYWKSVEPNIDEFLPHILDQLRINHDKVYPLLEK